MCGTIDITKAYDAVPIEDNEEYLKPSRFELQDEQWEPDSVETVLSSITIDNIEFPRDLELLKHPNIFVGDTGASKS